jgi:hypothetical protein
MISATMPTSVSGAVAIELRHLGRDGGAAGHRPRAGRLRALLDVALEAPRRPGRVDAPAQQLAPAEQEEHDHA